MQSQLKDIANKEDTFDRLDIRLGEVKRLECIEQSELKVFKISIDFGKFGIKQSVGRFTQHDANELLGEKVIAILNFPVRTVCNTESEVLVLGVQYPKAKSGEATPLTPLKGAKIGGKVF